MALDRIVTEAAQASYGKWICKSQAERESCIQRSVKNHLVLVPLTSPLVKLPKTPRKNSGGPTSTSSSSSSDLTTVTPVAALQQAISSLLRRLSRPGDASLPSILDDYLEALCSMGVADFFLAPLHNSIVLSPGDGTEPANTLAWLGSLCTVRMRQVLLEPHAALLTLSVDDQRGCIDRAAALLRGSIAGLEDNGETQFQLTVSDFDDGIGDSIQLVCSLFLSFGADDANLLRRRRRSSTLVTGASVDDQIRRLMYYRGFSRQQLQWLAQAIVGEVSALASFSSLASPSMKIQSLASVLSAPEFVIRRYTPRLSSLLNIASKLAGVDPQASKNSQRELQAMLDGVMANVATKVTKNFQRSIASHSSRSIAAEFGCTIRAIVASRRRTFLMQMRLLCTKLAARGFTAALAMLSIRSLLEGLLQTQKSKMVERDVEAICSAVEHLYDRLSNQCCTAPAEYASPLISPVNPTAAALSAVQPEAQFLKFCSSQLSKELWGIPLVNVLACFVALRQENLPPTDQALESMQSIVFRALSKLCLANRTTTVEQIARDGSDNEVREFLFFMVLLSCGGSRGMFSYLSYFGDFFVSSIMEGAGVPPPQDRSAVPVTPFTSPPRSAASESTEHSVISSAHFETFAGVYSNVVSEITAFVGTILEPDTSEEGKDVLPDLLGASGMRATGTTSVNVKARYSQLFSEAKFASLMYSLLGVMSPNSNKKIAPALVSTSLEQYWRSLAALAFEYHLNGSSLGLLDQIREVLEGTGSDIMQPAVFLLSSLNDSGNAPLPLHELLCRTRDASAGRAPQRGDEGFEVFKRRSSVVTLLRSAHALIHEIEDADRQACATAMASRKEILANMALINETMQFQGLVFDERMPIHLYPLLKKPLLSFSSEMARLISSTVSSYGTPDDTAAGGGSTSASGGASQGQELEKTGSFRTRSFRSFVFNSFAGAETYIPHFAGIVWTPGAVESMQLQGLVPRDLTLLSSWVRQFFSDVGGVNNVGAIGNKRRLSLNKVTAMLKQNSAVIIWRSFTRTVYSLLRDRLVESMTVRDEDKAECYQILAKTQNIVYLGLQKIDALSKVSLADEWQSSALIPALALVDDHDLATSHSAHKVATVLPSTVLQGIFLDVYNNATSSLTRAFMNVARFSSMLTPKQVDVLGRHIYATLVADRMQDVSSLFRMTVSEISAVQSVWATCTGKSRKQFEAEFARFLDLQPGCKSGLLFSTLNDLISKAPKIFVPSTFFSGLLLETIELNSESENCLFEHLSNSWGPCAHAVLLAFRSCGATKPQLVILLKFLRIVRTIIRFVSALRRSPELAAHVRYLPLKSLRLFFSAEGQRNALVTNAQTLSTKVDQVPSAKGAVANTPSAASGSHVGLVMHQTTVVLSALEALMRELLTVPDGDVIKVFSETVQDNLLGELTKTQLGKIFTLLCNVMSQQPADTTFCDAEAARSLLCAVFISVRQHDALRDQLRLPPPTSVVGSFTVQWPCLPALTEAFDGVSKEQRGKILLLVKPVITSKLRFTVDSKQKLETVNSFVTLLWGAIYAGATQYAGNIADVASVGLLQPLQPLVSVLTEKELRETCAVMIQALIDEAGKQAFIAPREALLHFVAAVLRSLRNFCAVGDTFAAVEDTAFGEFPMAEFKILAYVWLSVLDDISEIYPIAAFLYNKAFQQRILMEQQQRQQSGGTQGKTDEESKPACKISHFSSFLGLVHKISDDTAKGLHTSDDIQKAIAAWVETVDPPQETSMEASADSAPFPFRTVISCGAIALVGALEKSSSMAAARVFGPCAKLACQKALYYVETVSYDKDDTMSSSSSRRSSTMSATENMDDLGGSSNELPLQSKNSSKDLTRSPSSNAGTLSSPLHGVAASGNVFSGVTPITIPPTSQNEGQQNASSPISKLPTPINAAVSLAKTSSGSGSLTQPSRQPLPPAPVSPVATSAAAQAPVVAQRPILPSSHPVDTTTASQLPKTGSGTLVPAPPPPPPQASEPKPPSGFTLQQVAQHKSRGDCWLAVRGKVYNVTKLISTHPGGSGAILANAGKDGTSDFIANHDSSSAAHSAIQKFYVGDLAS